MGGGVCLQTLDQEIRLLRRNAGIRGREVHTVQRIRTVEHMRVRIDDSGDDGLSMQIDHLSAAAAMGHDRRIRADGLDACSADRQSGGPGGARVAGVNVTVNEQCIAGERRGLPAQRDQDCANTQLMSKLQVPLLSTMMFYWISASHSRSANATASGRSTGAMWPAPWISNSVACGIRRRMVSCCEIGDQVSSLPLSSRVGTPIMGRTDNASGRCNRALI